MHSNCMELDFLECRGIISLSVPGLSNPPQTMIISPFLEQLESAHQYQGKSNNCGPFSAAITAAALGQTKTTGNQLTALLNPVRWKGILPIFQRIPNSATLPWGTTYLLNQLQYKANWRPFSSSAALLNALPENVIQIVIIGEWQPLWAHYIIFSAYDDRRGYGFIDPAFTTPNLHWYSPAQFLSLWNHYGRVRITAYPVP